MYGDKSIGWVSVLRNPDFCVVKAHIATDQSTKIVVRALINETKNIISKVECKNCIPAGNVSLFKSLQL